MPGEYAGAGLSGVEVAVDNGIVRLRGEVEDRRGKGIAEDVAESVCGVMDVSNRLRVQRVEYGAIEE